MPIAVNGLVCGVITLAEMRNWNRSPLDATALTFTRAASSMISLGVKSMHLSRAVLNGASEERYSAGSGSAAGNIYQELKSPLTSLQGSIDLLKLKGFERPEDSQKILASMERSANRLISLINDR
jgi:signal transduction histidine kinase